MGRFDQQAILLSGGARPARSTGAPMGGAERPWGERRHAGRPGPTGTDMPSVCDNEDTQRRVGRAPTKRLGTREEIAGPVPFLLGHESRCMTDPEVAMAGGISQ